MPANQASREIYWNISKTGESVFFWLAIIAMGIFAYGIFIHLRRILSGKKVLFPEKIILTSLLESFAQISLNSRIAFKQALAGIMHLSIMWGFIVLFIGTCIVALEYDFFQKILGYKQGFFYGQFFLSFELFLDIFGGLFILGLSIALFRRYCLKPSHLKWKLSDLILPVWLLIIAITGFLVEALRLTADRDLLGYNPIWSPLGSIIGFLFINTETGTLVIYHRLLWWFHSLIALGWLAYLPFGSKVIHILSAACNTLLKPLRPNGRLAKLDVESAFENDTVLGIEKISDLTRKDLLDVVSCTDCGRCVINCPANLSGKILSPREIVLKLQDEVKNGYPVFGKKKDPQPIIGSSISTEEIWSCTTCLACVEVCPVYIDPLSKIIELRQNEVLIQDKFPNQFADVFSGIEKRGNPWNQHPSTRLDWAKGLDVITIAQAEKEGIAVDFLFWIGCSATFEPRNQKIARSVVRILHACNVSFAVLGEEETCTGDFVRRMGHEHLFQIQAQGNVETLAKYKFKKILTVCPHCFNTLKNDYSDFGGSYEVMHHTQLIKTLLDQNKIIFSKPIDNTITYHDSCYLGRYNGVFDTPRDILKQINGVQLVEMERNRSVGMCCGGGGGLMWIEEDQGKRTNELRVQQAKTVLNGSGNKDSTIASACPFCMTMMEDALSGQEAKMRNKDIAELVAMAMGIEI